MLLLGVAYYANIHHIGYFIGVQIYGGIMQVYIYITIHIVQYIHMHEYRTKSLLRKMGGFIEGKI